LVMINDNEGKKMTPEQMRDKAMDLMNRGFH